MPLTPLDIQNKEFRRSLRGYNEQEVDEFLDEIVRDMESLVRESASLREQVGRLEQRIAQYVDIEDVLKRTLVKAEEAAGGMRLAAQKEAELVVREAREKSRQQLERARRDYAAEREGMAKARQEYRNFLARVRGELRGQLEAVDALAAGLAQSPEATDQIAVPDSGPPASPAEEALPAEVAVASASAEPVNPPPQLDQDTKRFRLRAQPAAEPQPK